MNPEIVMVIGIPASGKTSQVEPLVKKGYQRLNRDLEGGTVYDLAPKLEQLIEQGNRQFVLDNTHSTRKSRKPFIDVGRKYNIPVRCVLMDTSIEDAQVNACTRMVQRYGRLLMPEEIVQYGKKDPNMFPPSVLFDFRKRFEPPEVSEGFATVYAQQFTRTPRPGYTSKALILDYDGTLRETRSGAKYPTTREDIKAIEGRTGVLERYAKDGYRLLGVTNQSGVAKGEFTLQDAKDLCSRTNELLGIGIEAAVCPHSPAPINCYCRKPMPGLAVQFIEKYKLDPAKCIMVGDMTTDRTFATRAGFQYLDAKEFFSAGP
jgi:histidinol-phosphate phosphatase family protein